MAKLVVLLLLAVSALSVQNVPVVRLMELARRNPNSAEFREALTRMFSDGDLKAGKAVAGYGPDSLWAVEAATRPALFVDNAAGPPMTQIPGNAAMVCAGNNENRNIALVLL